MAQASTIYGLFTGADYIQHYPNGNIKQLVLTQPNHIETPYGVFIPQFSDDGLRRKRVKPVIFYENGVLKNLPLQNQVMVNSTLGSIPAELITWHENGEINRVFPLNGSLTGFWTEEDEYELAQFILLDLPVGKFHQKVISVQFYKTKELKNLTIWPNDTIVVQSPFGPAEARIGMSFYPGGQLKAFEPRKPVHVDTPIGRICAYDSSAQGIHGDSLSLKFHQSGQVEGLSTTVNSITVTDSVGNECSYAPQLRPSLFNLNGKVLVPLKISFKNNMVCFGDNPADSYDIQKCRFKVIEANFNQLQVCTSCNGCSNCSVM